MDKPALPIQIASVVPGDAISLLADAADLMLLLDGSHRIVDVEAATETGAALDLPVWRGRSFPEIVASGSAEAAETMLDVVRRRGRAARFDIGHSHRDGGVVPIRYSASRTKAGDGVLLFGIASPLTPSISEATAYRGLFEIGAGERIVIAPATQEVLDCNEAASRLLNRPSPDIVGMRMTELLDPAVERRVDMAIRGVSISGRSDRMSALPLRDGRVVDVTLDRLGGTQGSPLLARFLRRGPSPEPVRTDSALASLLEDVSDPTALLDEEGRLSWFNPAFAERASMFGHAMSVGEPFTSFPGLHLAADLDRLLARVRRDGSARLALGNPAAVGSRRSHAILRHVRDAAASWFSVTIDGTEPPVHSDGAGTEAIASEIAGRIGRAPLRELLRDTTDEIEKRCIEAALRLSDDNRAAAARVLGLSRQALYLKLERYGID